MLERAIKLDPSYPLAPALASWQAVYAAALAHLARTEEARKVVQDLLGEWPDLTIGLLCQSVPSTAPDYLSCYAEGLRKAGLPE